MVIIAISSTVAITVHCLIKIIDDQIAQADFLFFDGFGVLGYIGIAMYTFDTNIVAINIKGEA